MSDLVRSYLRDMTVEAAAGLSGGDVRSVLWLLRTNGRLLKISRQLFAHREKLDFRWHRWSKRDRDLHVAPLAGHRPIAAQRILHVIEAAARVALADFLMQSIQFRFAMSLVAI